MFKKSEIVRLRAADLQFVLETLTHEDGGDLVWNILNYLEHGKFPEKMSVDATWCFCFLKEQLDSDNKRLTDNHPVDE